MKFTIILISLLVFIAGANAAKPVPGSNDPLVLAQSYTGGLGGPVEQQSPGGNSCTSNCVVNSTNCVWSIDNRLIYGGYGILNAGASVSANPCLVADWVGHILGLTVNSSSPDLTVTVCYQPQDQCFSLISRPYGRDYEYRGCIVGPFYAGRFGGPWDARLQPIPDSNGGVGLQTQITVAINNPSGKNLRNVLAQFEIGSSEPSRQDRYCQGGDPGPTFDINGVSWQDSL